MSLTTDLRDRALQVVGVLEPDTMTGEQAAAAVADLATAEHAVSSALMFAALRVARTNAWQGRGFASVTDWFADAVGVSVREAAAMLGTARKADRLPKTKDAMKKGDLSPDQAGAVASGAAADPDAEDDLIDSAANDTNRALKDKAAKARAAATDSATRERRIRMRRSLRRGTDADGAFYAHIYGPGIDAAAFEAMIRPFEEHLFRTTRTDGVRDTFENRSHDAFFAMLAHLAAAGGSSTAAVAPAGAEAPADGGSTGDPGPGAQPDDVAEAADSVGTTPTTWTPPWDPDRSIALPTKVPGGQNVKVIVLVDHTALLRGHTACGETCEIAGVGPISVAAARAIARDDPFLAVVVRKGRDVVSVAHHGRGLNAHQRTALEATGLRCWNRACNRTIALEVDHRVPYDDDPTTKLDNQDPLCPGCHRLKTHHGWHLEPGAGPRRFLPPDSEPDRSGAEARPPTEPHAMPCARVEQPALI